jgi:hypothetical protein
LRSGSRANPRASSNSIFPSAHSTASLRQPKAGKRSPGCAHAPALACANSGTGINALSPVTPPHHDDSDKSRPCATRRSQPPADPRGSQTYHAPRRDKLAHRRLGPSVSPIVLGDDGANAKSVPGSALVIHAGVSLAP